MEHEGFVARARRVVERHRWIIPGANISAGVLFLAGCLAFFSPRTFTLGVGPFLTGSTLMLLGSLAEAVVRR